MSSRISNSNPYIINPLTGRKVKTTGRIGMRLKLTEKRNIKMLGGDSEKIGEGTYGEVFHPALKCNIENGTNPLNKPGINRNNYVTKVYTYPGHEIVTRNAERKELDRIKSFNEIGRFHIPIEHSCLVKNDIEYPKQDYYKNIKIISTRDKPAIVFKHGGVPIYKLSQDVIIPNIPKLYSLFEGLVIMSKYNVLHFDIKEGNIMYSEKNGFKFIDFGMMFEPFKKDNVDIQRQITIDSFEYYIWPWDIKYYTPHRRIIKFTNHEDIEFEDYINKSSYNYKLTGNTSNINIHSSDRSELYEIITRNIKTQRVNYLHRLMKTVDVYSLGILLRRIKNIYDNLGKKTKELIELMIHDDAFKRPLPEEALVMFVDAMFADHNIMLYNKYTETINLLYPEPSKKELRETKSKSVLSEHRKKITRNINQYRIRLAQERQQKRKLQQQQRIKRLERERQQQRQQRQRQQIKRLFIKSGLGNICISNQ